MTTTKRPLRPRHSILWHSGRSCRCLLLVAAVLCVLPEHNLAQVVAADSLSESFGGAFARWLDRTRLTLDLSRRSWSDPDSHGWRSATVVGVDLQHVFNSPSGDFGTLVFQGFITGLHGPGALPVVLDSGRDWDFAFRSVWFNFNALGRGFPSIRIGHFEVPFGLEHSVDTNGWLRQTIKARNLGLIGDWGVSVNGVIPGLEYEASLTRGTNQDWTSEGGPVLIGARVATPRWRGRWIGVSLARGRVLSPGGAALWRAGLDDASTVDETDAIVERTRVGLEGGVGWRRFEAQGEISIGSDFDQKVLNGLLELDWEAYTQRALIYLQWKHYGQQYARGWVYDDTVVLGTRLWPSRSLATSAAVSLALRGFTGGAARGRLILQLRYRT